MHTKVKKRSQPRLNSQPKNSKTEKNCSLGKRKDDRAHPK